MPSVLRSAAALAFLSALTMVFSAPGCSRQGEGERCEKNKTGNSDCDSGLTCVPDSELLEEITARCCPEPGEESDSRCTRRGGSGTAGSGAGGSSVGGSAGSGGTTATAGGTPATDGGTPATDGGTPATDGGTPVTDGGTPGVIDAGGAGGASAGEGSAG